MVKEVEVIKEVEKAKVNRLDTVKSRGKLICASRNDVPGYGSLDAAGNNVDLDIDLCRALAMQPKLCSSASQLRLWTQR